MNTGPVVRGSLVVASSLVLAACLGGSSDEAATVARGPEGSDGNLAPSIEGSPPTSVMEGETFMFEPTAEDQDGDPLIFGIDGKPGWLSFDTGTGQLTGTASADDVGTYRGIVVWVTDGDATALLEPFDLSVTPLNPTDNTPPTLEGTPAESVLEGEEYEFVPDARDDDGDTLTFTIVNRPSWASFDRDTGRIGGIPPPGSAGTYEDIVISVRDGQANASLPPFDIEVETADTNSSPKISGEPPGGVEAGEQYSFVPTASDPDDDPLTFTIENRPDWASFDASTGRLAGTPGEADVGSFDGITIRVSDGVTAASLPSFSITVTESTQNQPPVISGTPEEQATAGESYVFAPDAEDPDGDPLTFFIGNRPDWAAFDRDTGVLQGTPTNTDAGTYAGVVISVSDGRAVVELPAFAVSVVAVNEAPTISGVADDEVLVGEPYSFTPTADDPDGDALMFSIQDKPEWAAFDTATGQLQGTPGEGAVGTHSNIRISVTDGDATASLAAFSIDVKAVATGSATLTWTAPTENVDGSPLGDLAGYSFHWGKTAGAYTQSATVDNPGITTYVVENLTAGTWYFSVRAFNESGAYSDHSNEDSKTIQ